jgi:HD-like signal output (HDOD) protein
MIAVHQLICELSEESPFPDVYLEIRQLLRSPDASIRDFEELVENDPLLARQIIRIANSDFFGFNRKAYDLYDAISLIGVIQLHDLFLSSICLRIFYRIPEYELSLNKIWQHGIKRGIAARTIGKFCGFPAYNRLFALGLLLEIGHVMMTVKAPELASKALPFHRPLTQSLNSSEREYFGFDFCQLGAALIRHWHLPEVYAQTIEYHSHPELAEPDYRYQTTLLYLANSMLETPGHLYNQISQMPAYPQLFSAIPENIEEIIVNEIANHVIEVFSLLRTYE